MTRTNQIDFVGEKGCNNFSMSNQGPEPVGIVQLRRYKRMCRNQEMSVELQKSVEIVRVSDSIGQRNALASSGGKLKRECEWKCRCFEKVPGLALVGRDKAAKCLDSLEHRLHCPCSKLHR